MTPSVTKTQNGDNGYPFKQQLPQTNTALIQSMQTTKKKINTPERDFNLLLNLSKISAVKV